MRVAVRVDASPLIGGGHLMRCLTLADALAERGAQVVFVSAAMPESLEARIVAAGHELARIDPSPDLERAGANWHEPPLSIDAQARDAEFTREACGDVDWLIVDHYLLDVHWHGRARATAEKLLVIDDLANRQYDCDILLDQTFGRAASDYRELVPAGATILAGSLYALLRPEFAAERDGALDRRQAPAEDTRILVTMGTTDPGGISEKIVDAVLDAAPGCVVDVVIGSQASGEPGQGRDRVSVHVDSQHMAKQMRDADIAIGAAGATSWERCCLGLPSIAFILAENQRVGALALAEAGAAVAIERVADVGSELATLLADRPRRARMSAAAAAIVDGAGTRRVVHAVLGGRSEIGDVSLRSAKPEDSRRLWLWRNDPHTRKQSRTHDPVAWIDHARWFERTFDHPSRTLLVAESNGQPVGMVRFDDGDDGSEVSINVAPDQRGSGFGAAILSAACSQHSRPITASISEQNAASRKLFESSGFHQVGSSEPGFLRYELPLEQLRRGHA